MQTLYKERIINTENLYMQRIIEKEQVKVTVYAIFFSAQKSQKATTTKSMLLLNLFITDILSVKGNRFETSYAK